MKLAAVCLAYNEERFIPKYIEAMQDRVDEIVVLRSTKPWEGEEDDLDNTANIARDMGATVIEYQWESESEQRNAGQDYCMDYDWVITLDPDEFILDADWETLIAFLEEAELDAYTCQEQLTYWKKGFVIDPPEDYVQIIATRPHVRYIDKRVINSAWDRAPLILHHFSWARTDAECLSKISHYAHAHELNKTWYNDVWMSDKTEDLHPMTPPSLKKAVRVILPDELERLKLWP